MEARLARVEKDLEDLLGLVGNLIKDVAELKGKMSQMPTTIQLATFTVGSVIAVAGLVFAIARAMSH